ncbi:hypothetical protein K9556_004942 [Escherichia coli]|nr:hypothetical protein [Escherichia coli]EHO7980330.1 hypothetical protein [Escherichia coli]EIC1922331.1 hypothetical protein [Escherichia coli]EKB8141404.1 hypothetical protein [Escherichia coli]ELJ4287919.1 hypothetical protein [Escherichia coli]
MAVTHRVLIFQLPSRGCASHHPKANFSLVGTNHPHPINVKEPASLFRLTSSVLLMAE